MSRIKGSKLTLEHRRKLSNAHKGRTPANIDILKTYWKGRKRGKMSEEMKLKISKSERNDPIAPMATARAMFPGLIIKNNPTAKGVVNPNEKRKPAMKIPK